MQISHLLELLKDGVAWTSIRADEVCDIPMIDFIRSDTKFDDDTIYIGSFPKVEAFLSRLADQEPMHNLYTVPEFGRPLGNMPYRQSDRSPL